MTVPQIDFTDADAEIDLQKFEHIAAYARRERLPWRRSRLGANDEIRSAEAYAANSPARRFPLRECRYLPRRKFRDVIKIRFEDDLVEASRNALRRATPEASAHRLLQAGQKLLLTEIVLAAAVSFAIAPVATLIALNVLATTYFLAAIFFRLSLVVAGYRARPAAPPPLLDDADLPVVTVLLPVHDEADGLAALSAEIDALDYPADKLDVKLLLEADDEATIRESVRLRLDERYDCVIIPVTEPRTKPKACNHALYLARGDLIVIYDAEDAPEQDQLRKAAAAFANADPGLACVQARLNFYNADENWLTRGIMAQTPPRPLWRRYQTRRRFQGLGGGSVFAALNRADTCACRARWVSSS